MLTDVNGKEHRLSDYRGKKVYIKFWASWCSVCMATLADTDMLAGSGDKDFVVLSVVAPGFGGEMKKEDFVKWYKGLGYNNLPVLLDEEPRPLRRPHGKNIPPVPRNSLPPGTYPVNFPYSLFSPPFLSSYFLQGLPPQARSPHHIAFTKPGLFARISLNSS